MFWCGTLLVSMLFGGVYLQKENDIAFAINRGKTYYFPHSFGLSWQQAVEYCRNHGMFLVTIQTKEQLGSVVEYLNTSGYWKTKDQLHMWTSLNDIGEEGQYFWASTGERLTFDRWKAGEPDNKRLDTCTTENCVVLSHHPVRGVYYSFDDRPCQENNLFLCESLG
uniref:C-type lectin domain-containing protein n=1 Tax=Anopheles dirus TaxID=7168 RepID=A0A182NEP2_9DIPT